MGRVLLASSVWGPGMLLNIPQCTRQLQQQIIWVEMSVILRMRNPGLMDVNGSTDATKETLRLNEISSLRSKS